MSKTRTCFWCTRSASGAYVKGYHACCIDCARGTYRHTTFCNKRAAKEEAAQESGEAKSV